ncbi:Signal transduction histidine kinase [Amycolatopsis xylanica]|uniref:histidine kinase n=1 Tax=Amycolatopsis xylanica TaxID=589385 RepID=A0A1H3T4M6_9PSEU|nr:histidine kinase [Amycolatopsis xylanica]SDZ44685.1 Signal transduction histidine kinase [Amycolatopsis xylanica]
MRRPVLPDTLAPGWLVVQLLGTLLIAATLATAREHQPLVWVLYGVSTLAWLGFVVTDHRWPRTAQCLLAASTLIPAMTLGIAEDSSAIILCVITLGRLATMARLSVLSIVLVGSADIVLALVLDKGWQGLVDAGVMLLLLLLGLNRRQYEVQAEQAHALLEQTKLAQAEHARAAALDERTRIAREIHDVLAHSLGALGVQLELAEALLAEKSDVDSALATIRRSRRLAADGLAEARNAVAALRRDVPSLIEALEALVDAHHGVVDFEATGAARPLPTAATVSLVGTAREALTNAAKHAPGVPVTMTLEFEEGTVRLIVRNEASGVAGTGFGLTGMGERLALADGTLTSGFEGKYWVVSAEVRA